MTISEKFHIPISVQKAVKLYKIYQESRSKIKVVFSSTISGFFHHGRWNCFFTTVTIICPILSDWVSKRDKKESINFYLDLILKVLNPQLISVWCIIYALKLYLNAFHNHIYRSICDWLKCHWIFLIGKTLSDWCRSISTIRIEFTE